MSSGAEVGRVTTLRRHPVKSMQGEELAASLVTERGLRGDRAWGLIDSETGKVVSAKHPRKWPNIFAFRARLSAEPEAFGPLPAVQIALPDGSTVCSDQPDASERLSHALGREVLLSLIAPEELEFEYHWPDLEVLPIRDEVTSHPTPGGTFFDSSPLMLMTTSTLESLHRAYPEGRFEIGRFRPNLVLELDSDGAFPEEEWVGRTLCIGDARIEVLEPCMRCVMTTLAQDDLPSDIGILRTVFEQNQGNAGVKAAVVASGSIRRGDAVLLA